MHSQLFSNKWLSNHGLRYDTPHPLCIPSLCDNHAVALLLPLYVNRGWRRRRGRGIVHLECLCCHPHRFPVCSTYRRAEWDRDSSIRRCCSRENIVTGTYNFSQLIQLLFPGLSVRVSTPPTAVIIALTIRSHPRTLRGGGEGFIDEIGDRNCDVMIRM